MLVSVDCFALLYRVIYIFFTLIHLDTGVRGGDALAEKPAQAVVAEGCVLSASPLLTGGTNLDLATCCSLSSYIMAFCVPQMGERKLIYLARW